MRQGIAGLAVGLVIGTVIASGAAFALGAAVPTSFARGGAAVPPQSAAIVSQAGTRSVDVTRSVEASNVPNVPASHETTPVHARQRVMSQVRGQQHQVRAPQVQTAPMPTHAAPYGTVCAPMSGNQSGTAHGTIHHDWTCND